MARSYPGVDWVSLRDPIIRHLGRAAMVIALLRGPHLFGPAIFCSGPVIFPNFQLLRAFSQLFASRAPRLQGFTGRGASVRLETAGAIVARRTQNSHGPATPSWPIEPSRCARVHFGRTNPRVINLGQTNPGCGSAARVDQRQFGQTNPRSAARDLLYCAAKYATNGRSILKKQRLNACMSCMAGAQL